VASDLLLTRRIIDGDEAVGLGLASKAVREPWPRPSR
jgi:enoyl-CoA hydratase/carnithine racemase